MTDTNLETMLADGGDIVTLLRNQQTGPNAYPGVPAEYSNWRSEQQAWAQTCVLFNQSYHMVDLEVSGPDAFAMLNHLGVNNLVDALRVAIRAGAIGPLLRRNAAVSRDRA